MRTETVNITELLLPEHNVRTHPEKQIVELARAVEMFGQTRPIVVDEGNTVLVGNGLVSAFKSLGREAIDALRISGLSDTEKKKLMLSDNKIFDLGFNDYSGMMTLFKELDDLDIPGFDKQLLQSMTTSTEAVTRDSLNQFGLLNDAEIEQAIARTIPQGSTEPDLRTVDNSITCPHCGHSFVPC